MRDAHFSGFHGATRDQWLNAVQVVARQASVLAVTECDGRTFVPDDWHQTRVKAECQIGWDDSHHYPGPRSDCEGVARLTRAVFYTSKGGRKDGVEMTWVLLADKSGRTLLRAVAHMPASVQRGDGFSGVAGRVTAWRLALRGLRREVRRLSREVRPDEVTVSADFNVDLQRRHWRAVINTGLRGTGLTVKAPGSGTHHARAIDAHATTMRREATHVLDAHKGFDHRPVVSVLTRKENKP